MSSGRSEQGGHDPAGRPREIREIEFVKSATRREQCPRDGLPMVAFAGRSNVGKSSLLNVLANRKRLARVSSTPGHTQLLNFFLVDRAAYFVDLPGYGFARAPKGVSAGWEKMITGFLRNNPALQAVVAIFDIRRQLTTEDTLLLGWLRHHRIPFIGILTKADKLPRARQVEALRDFREGVAQFDPLAVILFSATTRQGRDELLARVTDILGPTEGGE